VSDRDPNKAHELPLRAFSLSSIDSEFDPILLENLGFESVYSVVLGSCPRELSFYYHIPILFPLEFAVFPPYNRGVVSRKCVQIPAFWPKIQNFFKKSFEKDVLEMGALMMWWFVLSGNGQSTQFLHR